MRALVPILLLLAWLADPATAHPPAEVTGGAAPRSGPIVIDGRPDEAAWDAAPALDDFVERTPNLRAEPPVRTVVRVLYDAEALWVAAWCYQPEQPVARVLNRDTFDMFSDDAISLKIDPAHDHRTTLGFALNAAGARMDYRGVNESTWQLEFDAAWQGRAAVVEGGWTAEFRIPLTELGLSPWDPPEMIGLNVSRDHSRRSATYDWSVMPPPFSPISSSLYGHLTGFEALPELAAGSAVDPGPVLAWYTEPWVLAGVTRDRPDPSAPLDTDAELDAGVDLGLQLRSGWSTHLTVNTDFAEVELDDQVVNLTRFSVFLPEKRGFFLEDADLFAFGHPEDSQLFHSRRIGLDEGREIPILTGVKAVGPAGDHARLGALDVITRPAGDLPWTSNLVVRGQGELGRGSNLGVMVTQRQSLEDAGDWNLTAGLDGAWRGGGSPLLVEGFAVVSGNGPRVGEATGEVASPDDPESPEEEEATGLGAAAAVDLSWRGELFRPALGYAFFSEDLRADLGFFRRRGIHRSTASFAVQPRVERRGVETVTFQATGSAVADEGATELLDWSGGGSVTVEGQQGWTVGASGDERRETVREAFTVGPAVEIAEGAYRMTRGDLWGATPGTAAVGLDGSLSWQEYYGGEMLRGGGNVFARPGTWLRTTVGTDIRRVRFPDDPREDFTSVAVNGEAWIGFSPDLNLRLAAQWNRIAALVRLQARLRWTWRRGSDLFVVYQGDLEEAEGWSSTFQSVLVKLTLQVP
ncbi:MAG: DUF5916 domain-containing protein [Myxococcota bacterium]